MRANHEMMANMELEPSGDADKDFVDMMISRSSDQPAMQERAIEQRRAHQAPLRR